MSYLPLHPERMSTPITCLPKRQDVLFHVLYCSDFEYIKQLIEESVIYIAHEYPSAGVHAALQTMRPSERDTLDKLRARFFILLNQDMHMRKRLGKDPGKSCILSNVCDFKANRFYDELNNRVIPAFAQDETMSLEAFIESLRDTYICS